mmetsp:Transcript_46254/g.108539  ORF Transcript_46254/g.108539 Transcript_46254/m.108539 type:complete len:221 (+) Transcript_46254:63-725(+)
MPSRMSTKTICTSCAAHSSSSCGLWRSIISFRSLSIPLNTLDRNTVTIRVRCTRCESALRSQRLARESDENKSSSPARSSAVATPGRRGRSGLLVTPSRLLARLAESRCEEAAVFFAGLVCSLWAELCAPDREGFHGASFLFTVRCRGSDGENALLTPSPYSNRYPSVSDHRPWFTLLAVSWVAMLPWSPVNSHHHAIGWRLSRSPAGISAVLLPCRPSA